MGSLLVQIIAYRLLSEEASPETMLTYYKLNPYEQTSVKFQSKHNNFHQRKCICKCQSGKIKASYLFRPQCILKKKKDWSDRELGYHASNRYTSTIMYMVRALLCLVVVMYRQISLIIIQGFFINIYNNRGQS